MSVVHLNSSLRTRHDFDFKEAKWLMGGGDSHPRAESSSWKSLQSRGHSSWRWYLWPGDLCLWRVCRFFISWSDSYWLVSLRESCWLWSTWLLAGISSGLSPLWRSFPDWNVSLLFCEMCTRAFGMSLFFCSCVCSEFVLFHDAMWKEHGFRFSKTLVNRTYITD